MKTIVMVLASAVLAFNANADDFDLSLEVDVDEVCTVTGVNSTDNDVEIDHVHGVDEITQQWEIEVTSNRRKISLTPEDVNGSFLFDDDDYNTTTTVNATNATWTGSSSTQSGIVNLTVDLAINGLADASAGSYHFSNVIDVECE